MRRASKYLCEKKSEQKSVHILFVESKIQLCAEVKCFSSRSSVHVFASRRIIE